MSIRITFAEQSTGIVTTPSGEWALGAVAFQTLDSISEAIIRARGYFKHHPDHEASIESSVTGHRLVPPVAQRFSSWIERFRLEGIIEDVCLGMTFGEVIFTLGWPDDCSMQLQRSPFAIILRYQPYCTDFHFDDNGRLCLVFQDDPEDPVTILAR